VKATSKKVIQFLLPGAGIAGGIKVVFQYANHLVEQGHIVRIYYPGVMHPATKRFWAMESKLRLLKYKFFPSKEARNWFPLKADIFQVPSLEKKYIGDGDVVIATGNETAQYVVDLPERAGKKFYFIQDWENWGKTDEEIAYTWRLPLHRITISSTLAARAEKLGVEIDAIITNGIDSSVFYNNTPHEAHGLPKLLMLSHHDERKGLEDGFKAISLVRNTYPDISLTMFGAGEPLATMPAQTTFVQRPDSKTLRKLYSDADIFISPSHHEGCQLPPMEAMFCRTAVVATNVGGIPDYAIAGKTALVVEPHQPEKLAQAIISLIENPKLMSEIREAGYRHIRQFTLEKAAQKFEKAILD
jgi:hypothetical protein